MKNDFKLKEGLCCHVINVIFFSHRFLLRKMCDEEEKKVFEKLILKHIGVIDSTPGLVIKGTSEVEDKIRELLAVQENKEASLKFLASPDAVKYMMVAQKAAIEESESKISAISFHWIKQPGATAKVDLPVQRGGGKSRGGGKYYGGKGRDRYNPKK
jgi:hypothetical protein